MHGARIWNFGVGGSQLDLARFVLHNCRESGLAEVLQSAGVEFRTLWAPPDDVWDGYESADPEKVQAQVKAVYLAMHKRNLTWALEPQDRFVSPLHQFVRSPTVILQDREADCTDIVAMFASLLLRIGLNPLIVCLGPKGSAVATHAILGWWLEDECFPEVKITWPTLADRLSQISLLEGTAVLYGSQMPFEDALVDTGVPSGANLSHSGARGNDTREPVIGKGTALGNFKVFYAIDVRRARMIASGPRVLAVAGTGQRTGKTLLSVFIAEILAAGGSDVSAVDLDILAESLSLLMRRRNAQAPVQFPDGMASVAQEITRRCADPALTEQSYADGFMLDVTPHKAGQGTRGRILLVPACPADRPVDPGALLDMLANARPGTAARVVESLLLRVRSLLSDEDYVILDCPSNSEALTVAAVDAADLTFVVASDDKASFESSLAMRHSLTRSGSADRGGMYFLVNRVRSREQAAASRQWEPLKPLCFIPEQSRLSRAWARQKHLFGGREYRRVSREMRGALLSALGSTSFSGRARKKAERHARIRAAEP